MPSLPLTATQQAPLQSLFSSSPFDSISDLRPRADSISLPASRPRAASADPSSSPASPLTSPPTGSPLSSVRRASATSTPTTPPLPTRLASLTFTTPGQCRSITIPNPSSTPIQLHLTSAERKALRVKGFRLPDVKSQLRVPARGERPLVVVWDGRWDGENDEQEEAGRMVVHQLRLESSNQTSTAVLIRLSATLPLPTAAAAAASVASSPLRSSQRAPLRKLTDWLSAGFTSASPKSDNRVDLFSTRKVSRSARSHSTSVTATNSTASCSGSSPPSPAADDEWSSPRHASEPAVLSPLGHQHCYTLSAADVYRQNQSMTNSPTQSARKLSSDGHSRSFSFPAQAWPVPVASD